MGDWNDYYKQGAKKNTENMDAMELDFSHYLLFTVIFGYTLCTGWLLVHDGANRICCCRQGKDTLFPLLSQRVFFRQIPSAGIT